MAIDCEEIIQHFRQCYGLRRGRFLHNVTYHLVSIILQQRDFPNMRSFIEFCKNPDNLRSWLPSQKDRIIFSAGLVETLRSMDSTGPALQPSEQMCSTAQDGVAAGSAP